MTFCPDCEREILEEEFVAHREQEHPPTLKVVNIEESLHDGERMEYEGVNR